MILYLVLTDKRFRVVLCILQRKNIHNVSSSRSVSVKTIDLNAQIRAIQSANGVERTMLYSLFSLSNSADSTLHCYVYLIYGLHLQNLKQFRSTRAIQRSDSKSRLGSAKMSCFCRNWCKTLLLWCEYEIDFERFCVVIFSIRLKTGKHSMSPLNYQCTLLLCIKIYKIK